MNISPAILKKVPVFDHKAYNKTRGYENTKKFQLDFTRERRKFIMYCIKKRLSFEQIGEILGLTRARIYQIYRYETARHTYASSKRAVKRRDGKHCKICNVQPKILHTHHIGDSADHSIKNLISLCPACHAKMHKYERTIKKLKVVDKSPLQM